MSDGVAVWFIRPLFLSLFSKEQTRAHIKIDGIVTVKATKTTLATLVVIHL